MERQIVAKIYSEDVMERVRTRRRRAALRLRARQAATRLVAKVVDGLISGGAPDEFDSEEQHAFLSALIGHKLRMVGHLPQATRAAGRYDAVQWDPRYSKEDFAELRRLGYPVADWRL